MIETAKRRGLGFLFVPDAPSIRPPRKRGNASSETWTRELSQYECARRQWEFRRVSWFDARAKRTHDLLGMFDALAFAPRALGQRTVGLQYTSRENLNARVAKLRAHEDWPLVLLCGWRVLCWGWRKDGRLVEVEVEA